jgi:aerobic carbon-monoxide dehydrogenase small subunit
MKAEISLHVNGKQYYLIVEPEERLLDVLRQRLRLTGAKEGCGEGECGACTVIMDGDAVNSCMVLAYQARGADILTIEGLASKGELDAIQQAFITNGAIQCGYCTPGMIMSAKALLMKNPNPSVEEIKMTIAGNLCRCTGYVNIVKAIQAAACALKGADPSEQENISDNRI